MKRKIPKVKWLTREEFEEMLEMRCYQVLGITVAQFRKNYKAGKYRNRHDSQIAELAMMIRD